MDKGHLHLSFLGFLVVGAMMMIWKFLLTNLALLFAASDNSNTRDWGGAVSVIA